jgi:hypothetical protein
MRIRSPLLVLLSLSALSLACTPTVQSGDGAVVLRAPARAWKCAPNDARLPHFNQSAVKCLLDDGDRRLVVNAKLYRVREEDATTAEIFCVQDWKRAYANLFSNFTSVKAEVTDWRGMKACALTIEGASISDGKPTKLWELRAPSGLFVTTLSVLGHKELYEREASDVNATLDKLVMAPEKAPTSLVGGRGHMAGAASPAPLQGAATAPEGAAPGAPEAGSAPAQK